MGHAGREGATTHRTAETGATFTRHRQLNLIFVEGVQESILSVEVCEKALGYPLDKNKKWYLHTKMSLKMLL
jgi:hypothetical protein